MQNLDNVAEESLLATPVTRPPKQHFFGYYTKRQFDPSDKYLLGLECDIISRLQHVDDRATLGMVDLEDANKWIPLAETGAWNWQMGCMTEWLPGADKVIIYNDLRDGHFVSVIRDVERGEQRVLPVPVFEIAPDGSSALTLNFSRLWDVRPETGYCGVKDPWYDQAAPDDDGIFHVNLSTGKTEMVISHAEMGGFPHTVGMPPRAKRYFTHLLFNEDGSRFMFWYRCHSSDGGYYSCIYTAAPDGKDIHAVAAHNSHSVWLGCDKILAMATLDEQGRHNYLFTDLADDHEIVGEGLLEFGGNHATFSPDKTWILTDSSPDYRSQRTVVLYDRAAVRRVDIARFHSMPELDGPLRCDLHPRWNRAGNQVCIDSTHEGSRQMYLIDVRRIISDSERPNKRRHTYGA